MSREPAFSTFTVMLMTRRNGLHLPVGEQRFLLRPDHPVIPYFPQSASRLPFSLAHQRSASQFDCEYQIPPTDAPRVAPQSGSDQPAKSMGRYYNVII